MTLRGKSAQFFCVCLIGVLIITLLAVPGQAFTGRDGDEIISCTQLTEPFAKTRLAAVPSAVNLYHSEDEILEAYGWEIITQRQYELYIDIFRHG